MKRGRVENEDGNGVVVVVVGWWEGRGKVAEGWGGNVDEGSGYLPSNGATTNVVHRNHGLHFQGHEL